MNAMTKEQMDGLTGKYPEVFHPPLLQRLLMPLLIAAVILYLVFCWWLFSVGTVFSRANWGLAGSYLADWATYEARPDVRFRDGAMQLYFPPYGPYPDGFIPEWVKAETQVVTRTVRTESAGSALAQKSAGGFMAGGPGVNEAAPAGSSGQSTAATEKTVTETVSSDVRFDLGGGKSVDVMPGSVTLVRDGQTVVLDIVENQSATLRGDLPSWGVRDGDNAYTFYFGFAGRVMVDSEEVEVRHRFWGWSNFWFDTNSPFWGKSWGEFTGLLFGGERIDPKQSNLSLAWDNIVYNAKWQHGDVWIKLLQTIVMAFVGTLFATTVGLPLSFLAARNITGNMFVNQVIKRFFDFLRSVDMLIWALFFTRAFGPGPLAGISAIAVTDTGTLGKLYAEALENIDDKQREGVKSVGAAPILVQRFGVVPQVLPVFASQALYFWESNTRSATIIGAVGAGGIGLKLWEAMRTNSDWENVAYMVLLILIVVYVFDSISNALRSRLIGQQGR